MQRSWKKTLLLFGFYFGIVIAAMGWVSLLLLKADASESEANRRAEVEERVRLALWRMESALAPFISKESARPFYEYQAFHPAQQIYTSDFTAVPSERVMSASPLLMECSPHVNLYFQVDDQGRLSSPQIPEGVALGSILRDFDNHGTITTCRKRLDDLLKVVDLRELSTFLPPIEQEMMAPGLAEDLIDEPAETLAAEELSPEEQTAERRQLSRNRSEMERRVAHIYYTNNGIMVHTQTRQTVRVNPDDPNDESTRVAPRINASTFFTGMFYPIWQDGQLILTRRVQTGEKSLMQGIWLNLDEIQEWLLGEIGDLLPNAELVPIPPNQRDEHARRLAALPLKLVPGALPVDVMPEQSWIRTPLIVAWICMLLAAVAVGVLLHGVLSLSERRRSFVTAVSHELRTPLTTFRMYTDMLSGSMGEDPERRGKYLKTLRAEAQRLAHMVENVLSYARLEGRRLGGMEKAELGELVRRNEDRLRERAVQGRFAIDINYADQPLPIRANLTSVEQILFNLVDNACKYGRSDEGEDEDRIDITFGNSNGQAWLRVRDHGPGLNNDHKQKLFTPFHKSAQQAAKSAPGVGLGLALSRRLARNMNGDLRHLTPETGPGACFELSLPLERESS